MRCELHAHCGGLERDDAGEFAEMSPAVISASVHAGVHGPAASQSAGQVDQDHGLIVLKLGASPQDLAELSGVVALEARMAVLEAAGDCDPGEKLKTILPRAAKELGLLHEKGGLRRVRAAWEGTAWSWKAATFLDFLRRRDAMRSRRQTKAREELAALVLTLEAIQGRERSENGAHSETRGLSPDRVVGMLRAAGFDAGPPARADA